MGLVKKVLDVFGKSREPRETASHQLSRLPGDYLLFSTVLYNDSEVSHIVFSRSQGLFLINVSSERGTATYDGAHLCINRKPRSESIKKTLKDTFWLKSTLRERIGLDTPITPVVVFEQAEVAVDKPILGVKVIESSMLFDTIMAAPERGVLEDGVVLVLRELHSNHTMTYRRL
ncbi:MAG: hypothetical protein AB1805_13660 [Nitrospirota bacterium]